MKTYRNLFDKVVSIDNIYTAYCKAIKEKRCKPNVSAFTYSLETELCRLERELKSGVYKPGCYRSFYIYEPKKRLISAAPFRDRVVHHAICNVLEPLYEPTFIAHSYACRKDKGTHRALNYCTQLVRRYPYVLRCDIVKCFPNIDHSVLLRILERTIKDTRFIGLIKMVLESGRGVLSVEDEIWFYSGDNLFTPFERNRGLPIGNLTSQSFSNVYLNELDQFIKHNLRCKGYLRYSDDFLVFGEDKHRLHEIRGEIACFLVKLRLRMHPGKSQVIPTRIGVRFLGFRIYPTHRVLVKQNVRRARRRLRWLQQAYREGRVELDHIRESIRSWCAHAAHGDNFRVCRRLLQKAVFARS